MCRMLLGVASLAILTCILNHKQTKQTQTPERIMRDFPLAQHTAIDLRIRRFINSTANVNPTPFDQEFCLAWVALLYRYKTADLDSDDFRSLWLTHGGGAAEPFLYQQERAFQSFHINALSSIETGCFALYILASKFNDSLFGTIPTRTLRDVSINNCKTRLQQTRNPAPLASFFLKLTSDAQFQELSLIRNVSAHRAVIMRVITVGAAHTNQTELDLAGTRLPLDENFTETRRAWMVSRIQEIITQAELLLNAAGVPA